MKASEDKLKDFVRTAVADYEASPFYKIGEDAEEYYAKRNVTMEKFVKIIKTELGTDAPDEWSSNYKLKTLFFRRFIIRLAQYVLSNGVTFAKDNTKNQLQNRRVKFDAELSKIATNALVVGVCYGYWDYDHIVPFHAIRTEKHPGFCPMHDANTNQLLAGIRFWTAPDKTRRWVLYEADGVTEFYQKFGGDMVMNPKRDHKTNTNTTKAFGSERVNAGNYNGFPVIELFGNDLGESELVGIRESLDCYDFLKSGLANDINDATFYWLISNAGGMQDEDLVKFVNRVRKIHAAMVKGDATVEAHTVSIPYEATKIMLETLKDDLHDDMMVLNVEKALSGDKTATAMRLAYQPQDDKCGDFESQIRDFIYKLLALLEIDDEPSFSWNRIANQTEETNMVLSAAMYLDDDTVVDKLPFLTPEEKEEVKKRKAAEDMSRIEETEEVTEEVNENAE